MTYIKFLGSRAGSKLHDIKYFLKYLPKDEKFDIVCEPFAGSFALIRKVYKNSNKKLHINDNDKNLIDSILFIRDNQKKVSKIIEKYNEIKENTAYKDLKEKIEKYLNSDKSIPDYFKNHIISSYKIRGFYKKIPCDNNLFCNFLKKLEITCDDVTNIMKKYKDDERAFLFFDPPYLDSDNTNYKSMTKYSNGKKLNDNTVFYISLLEYIQTAKCKIMIIVNNNAITRFLYKDYIKGNYDKIYQLTKNKNSHLIISNYAN